MSPQGNCNLRDAKPTTFPQEPCGTEGKSSRPSREVPFISLHVCSSPGLRDLAVSVRFSTPLLTQTTIPVRRGGGKRKSWRGTRKSSVRHVRIRPNYYSREARLREAEATAWDTEVRHVCSRQYYDSREALLRVAEAKAPETEVRHVCSHRNHDSREALLRVAEAKAPEMEVRHPPCL